MLAMWFRDACRTTLGWQQVSAHTGVGRDDISTEKRQDQELEMNRASLTECLLAVAAPGA